MGITVEKEEKIVNENFESHPFKEKQINEVVIPVIQEEVVIEKEVVHKGSVIINKKVNTEDVLVEVPVMTEQVNVERIIINQYLDDSPPPIRYEGDTIIIPVLKEVFVKRLLLVEEIRVTKQVQTTNQSENILLRKEEVTITRKDI